MSKSHEHSFLVAAVQVKQMANDVMKSVASATKKGENILETYGIGSQTWSSFNHQLPYLLAGHFGELPWNKVSEESQTESQAPVELPKHDIITPHLLLSAGQALGIMYSARRG